MSFSRHTWPAALESVICFGLLIVGCSEPPFKQPDVVAPAVTITYPTDNAVIGDSVAIQATATDNEEIAEVRFYFDGAFTRRDTKRPYTFTLRPPENAFGTHTVFAKAFDISDNPSIPDTIAIRYRWSQIFDDGDDYHASDLRRLYVRSNTDAIQFRVLVEPSEDEYEPLPFVECVEIYMDVDQKQHTGAHISTIGADYRALLCTIANGGVWIHRVERYTSTGQWENLTGLTWYSWGDGGTPHDIGTMLAHIEDPDVMDVVVRAVSQLSSGEYVEDYLPDGPSKVTCQVDRLYLGDWQ